MEKQRRKTTRSEYRFVWFNPGHRLDDQKLHIGRLTVNNKMVIACTGEAELCHWKICTPYPLYRFMAVNAPICVTCRKRTELEIGQLI